MAMVEGEVDHAGFMVEVCSSKISVVVLEHFMEHRFIVSEV
jgi:hypothetical protein